MTPRLSISSGQHMKTVARLTCTYLICTCSEGRGSRKRNNSTGNRRVSKTKKNTNPVGPYLITAKTRVEENDRI